ncbi:Altronate dehydratase [Variovorax sp. SRS16]|nr:Altronate dehydratase [Variovorax sp. SRS16]
MDMKASVLHPQDNVATLLADVESGEVVRTRDAQVTAVEAVPFGHKIALCRIAQDGEIIKYGESIGRAMCEIREGALVHVHNLESQRGRGDIQSAGGRP